MPNITIICEEIPDFPFLKNDGLTCTFIMPNQDITLKQVEEIEISSDPGPGPDSLD